MPPKHPERRTLRLPAFDYSQTGAYFVTICTQNKLPWFGDVVEGTMVQNDVGFMVSTWWHKLALKFPGIELDAFVVMPNHVHGIMSIIDENCSIPVGADPCVRPNYNRIGAPAVRPHPAPRPTLGKIVQWFKTMTTNQYLANVNQAGWQPFPGKLWQRNYYEHVIRDEKSLNRIREYIDTNPLRWHLDRENRSSRGKDDFDDWLASFTKRPK